MVLEDLARASYQLGDLLRHVSFKLAVEDLVLRAERDEEARRRGGRDSGRERRAAREEDRRSWRAEAAEIWKRHPDYSVARVARRIWERLERERLVDDARWLPSDRTIRNRIEDLHPEGPSRRRAKSLEAN